MVSPFLTKDFTRSPANVQFTGAMLNSYLCLLREKMNFSIYHQPHFTTNTDTLPFFRVLFHQCHGVKNADFRP